MEISNRQESEIFSELELLCASKGYLHAIAYFCYRDNYIKYSENLSTKDMEQQFGNNRLIRTEVSTLIGLSCKNEISSASIPPLLLQTYIEKTEKLLEELHQSMMPSMEEMFNPDKLSSKDFNPFQNGNVLRESIFYGGDSAYSFQYRDLSLIKYQKDNKWFIENKGYSIEQAHSVISTLADFQVNNVMEELNSFSGKHPTEWTMLPAFEFTLDDITKKIELEKSIVKLVIESFIAPKALSMSSFNALDDFNPMNAFPIILINETTYLLFQHYSLVEALYETPFYWFTDDAKYKNAAMIHRGEFAEEFSTKRLKLIFGEENVFINIDILDTKGVKAGEIDVLVIYANRAIVLQAKSKKLTLKARKGNDNQLQDDFKKAIQDSYDQGYSCACLLENGDYKLVDSVKKELKISRKYKEIYIFCVVSDHYPALTFQVRQFLKFTTTSNIMPPFIMDIFMLDIMTEMLQSPLYFLSYVNRRTNYGDKLLSTHELIILSYHLKQNLWVDNQYGMMMIGDDVASDLALAMLARRENQPALKTPVGILTKYKDTIFGQIIKDIGKLGNSSTIDLGFMLLSLSGDTIEQINFGISKLTAMTIKDGMHHDLTLGIENGNTGLTIHCNNDSLLDASDRLERHCKSRKYTQKTLTWFGICIDPISSKVKFGLNFDYVWEQSEEMDVLVKDIPIAKDLKTNNLSSMFKNLPKKKKTGRNEKCSCGSGKKYKRCCIA